VSPDEVIDHDDVTLRRYRADDLDTLLQAVTDSADHLRPWMPWAAGYDRASAAEFLAKAGQDRTGPLANLNARLAVQCALNRTDILANAALGQGGA